MPFDLNNQEPEAEYGRSRKQNKDNSTAGEGVAVYFRNLVPRLVEHIEAADAVFGCVAWLTHPDVLDALRDRSTAIVVQKEDFLRPDLGAKAYWKRDLRRRYDALNCWFSRLDFCNMIGSLSTGGDSRISPVRCVGNYNRERKPAFPRMHNKFLVFCNTKEWGDTTQGQDVPEPYAVWTGSFNLTLNATQSLENALYITEPAIVQAYFEEFGQIMALSEPLDWSAEWSEPEWRIGS